MTRRLHTSRNGGDEYPLFRSKRWSAKRNGTASGASGWHLRLRSGPYSHGRLRRAPSQALLARAAHLSRKMLRYLHVSSAATETARRRARRVARRLGRRDLALQTWPTAGSDPAIRSGLAGPSARSGTRERSEGVPHSIAVRKCSTGRHSQDHLYAVAGLVCV